MAETRWVYVGNLNWFRPSSEIEATICSLLGSISIGDERQKSEKSLGTFMETVSVETFPTNLPKIKPRDRAKQHQGFALIRFTDCDIAKIAVEKMDGIALPDGAALGPLRAALSRAKVQMPLRTFSVRVG